MAVFSGTKVSGLSIDLSELGIITINVKLLHVFKFLRTFNIRHYGGSDHRYKIGPIEILMVNLLYFSQKLSSCHKNTFSRYLFGCQHRRLRVGVKVARAIVSSNYIYR